MSGAGQIYAAPVPQSEQHWPADLFILDPRGAVARERLTLLDITGPPRALVYGPYITLPPGIWCAQVLFSVDEPASQRRYRVEWGGLSDFVTHTFIPKQPGVFRAYLEHSWQTDTVVEARIILTESALEGGLEPLGVVVSALG